MRFQSSTWKFLCCAVVLLSLACGCNTFQTAYFGVEDEAIFSPEGFGETRKTIEKAKKDVDSPYARKKIDDAMQLGKQAARAYWEGHEEESEKLLAAARQTAMQAELYRQQPPPQYVNRTDAIVPSPEPPGSLSPDQPEDASPTVHQLILDRVFFRFNAYSLQPEAISRLNERLPLFKSKEDIFFEIAGYAEANEPDGDRLSQKRARSVFNHFVNQGIARDRMAINAYGKTDATELAGAGISENHNRRVEIRLLAEKPKTAVSDEPQEQYTIQVAAFNNPENAEAMRKELLRKGYPAYRIKAELSGNIWHRIRIGPYQDDAAAEGIFQKLKSEGYEAILIRLKEGIE